MARTVDADKERKEHDEEDVTPDASFFVNDAYDLVLYMAQGSSSRGVLIVTMNLHFLFEDGENKKGETLAWTEDDKKQFEKDFLQAVWDTWNEAFTIKTDHSSLLLKEVVVQFEFKTQIDGIWVNDHWELEVTKTDAFKGSSVGISSGNVTLDSEDINFASFKPQRGAAHEFGHMLALADEYLDKDGNPEENPHWTTDKASIMFRGETIRPRHFTPFASWLTEQYKTISQLTSQKAVFYVDDGAGGKWTVKGGSGFKEAKLK